MVAGWRARMTEHENGLAMILEMGARQYDPRLGRFLQVDPVAGGSCNDYDYACGDPINSSDLNGTFSIATLMRSIIQIVVNAIIGYAKQVSHGFAIAPDLVPYHGGYIGTVPVITTSTDDDAFHLVTQIPSQRTVHIEEKGLLLNPISFSLTDHGTTCSHTVGISGATCNFGAATPNSRKQHTGLEINAHSVWDIGLLTEEGDERDTAVYGGGWLDVYVGPYPATDGPPGHG